AGTAPGGRFCDSAAMERSIDADSLDRPRLGHRGSIPRARRSVRTPPGAVFFGQSCDPTGARQALVVNKNLTRVGPGERTPGTPAPGVILMQHLPRKARRKLWEALFLIACGGSSRRVLDSDVWGASPGRPVRCSFKPSGFFREVTGRYRAVMGIRGTFAG